MVSDTDYREARLIAGTIIILLTIVVLGISACDVRERQSTIDRNQFNKSMVEQGFCYINNTWMRCTFTVEAPK